MSEILPKSARIFASYVSRSSQHPCIMLYAYDSYCSFSGTQTSMFSVTYRHHCYFCKHLVILYTIHCVSKKTKLFLSYFVKSPPTLGKNMVNSLK